MRTGLDIAIIDNDRRLYSGDRGRRSTGGSPDRPLRNMRGPRRGVNLFNTYSTVLRTLTRTASATRATQYLEQPSTITAAVRCLTSRSLQARGHEEFRRRQATADTRRSQKVALAVESTQLLPAGPIPDAGNPAVFCTAKTAKEDAKDRRQPSIKLRGFRL